MMNRAPMKPFFEILHRDRNTRARAGRITTAHGDVETPMFMPVGTAGAVKTLDQADLEKNGAQIILGNTYHLHLRPGENIVAECGGLHKFMSWPHPLLTDSGGFQVFSLGLQKEKKTAKNNQGRLVQIDDAGATFTSHIDGSTHRFTPEISIAIQHKLGADIIMAFDECTPDDTPEEYAQKALARTHAWAKQSLIAHRENTAYHGYRQFLFGIIQGGAQRALREESARVIGGLDFDGIATGGESIGYNMPATTEILDWVYPLIPEDKPHYAMGVGLNPANLLVAVAHGVDMFDCVGPTRLARHGLAFSFNPEGKHRINLKNAAFKKDPRPIDEGCACSTCARYSRGYLNHLFAAEEIGVLRLASIHNLHFTLNLMRQTRAAILNNAFSSLLKLWNPTG